MIFNFTADQIHRRATSQDITPDECLSIWELLDRTRFGYIIDSLLINPMCTPQVLRLALGVNVYAAQALKNPSLDLYIYRNENLIDDDCIYFLDAIFSNLQQEDDKDSKRFIPLAIKIFEARAICNHALYGFMDNETRKQLALKYFSDLRNAIYSSPTMANSKISDFGIKALRETKDPEILQAIYDSCPKFNIDTLKLFANNDATPEPIISALTAQLTDYLSKDKGNLYYERVLNDLKDHPNSLTSQIVKKIEASSDGRNQHKSSLTIIDDPKSCPLISPGSDLSNALRKFNDRLSKNPQYVKYSSYQDNIYQDDIFS